jgi:ubiquinol-cytochrome c reductase cytochrome b subunit
VKSMSGKDRPIITTLANAATWVDRRLHIVKLWNSTGAHPIPKSSASWFYVFGSMTLLCFCIQILTGIFLSLVYIPSASEAFRSLEVLNFQVELGWLLRGMHYWGSNCMVIVMFLHMTQVFLWGAYKYPRELTWISGVFLLFLTLAIAFTGQVMRFDSDAFWGVGIGAAIMGRVPLIGAELVNLLLGGPIIGTDTLSRFFALHVFVLPGCILALVSMHLRLVLLKGINDYPEPGVQVNRNTYDAAYEEKIAQEGIPFVQGIDKDLIANGILLLVIVSLAIFVGPKGPGIPADPAVRISDASPDYPFLWLFAAAALAPHDTEVILFFVLPIIGTILLIGLPFYSNQGEKHFSRRPVAILMVILTYLALGMLTYAGLTGPWSPHMEAWSGTATKAEFIQARTPLELQGALLLQSKQCRNCHAIGGEGGRRGPDLSAVGARMDENQLVRQVIQGGGNMPAYGNNLSQHEVEALVAYLVSLRPANTIPAQNPATLPARRSALSSSGSTEHPPAGS